MLRTTAAALVLLSLVSGCTPASAPRPGLTITVNDGGDPARAWVVAPGAEPPARPGWSDDWGQWVAAAKATPLSALTVLLTVQGGTVSAVRVKVVDKRAPIAGTQYVVVGTDPLSTAQVEFDLDGSLEKKPVPQDGEVIAVTVQTQQCDCDWIIELEWPGGVRTIDNNGKPFRVSASTATVGRCVTYPDRVEKCEKF